MMPIAVQISPLAWFTVTLMYDPRIGAFKAKIVEYLNNAIETEEPIEVLDVFVYSGDRSLKLTHFGYRNLKNSYEFFELDVPFENNVKYAAAIDRLMKKPYYFKVDSRTSLCKIYTADRRFMKLLKIHQYDLMRLL